MPEFTLNNYIWFANCR